MASDSDGPPAATTPAFAELGLPEPLTRATDGLGFTHCTDIQALTLPHIIAGRDVAAQAQTGTGKTAAFLLGSFTRLLANAGPGESGAARAVDQPRMLVIAPTRELAMQIKKDADALGAHTGLRCAVVYGGIDYEKQRDELAAGVDVLIGTPGRLIDYFKQKVYNLRALEIVVLDEADRMFDLGFIADIRFLLRRMPEPGIRTSMLFSATLSHRVMELAYEHMNHPEELKTETERVTADKVIQSLYQPASDEKIPLLLGLLRDLAPPRSMVFVNTKRTAERIESYLVGNDIVCGLLSGDVRQNKRQKILADFMAGKIPVLIATDVAARGLHIDDVSHVFNYDLPQQAEDYVHRIGRTARAGTDGVAVSFACENYSFSLPEIQEFIGQNIPLAPITDELLVKPKRPARIERDRVERPGERGRGAGARGSGPRSAGSRSDARGGGSRSGQRGAGPRSDGRGAAERGGRGRDQGEVRGADQGPDRSAGRSAEVATDGARLGRNGDLPNGADGVQEERARSTAPQEDGAATESASSDARAGKPLAKKRGTKKRGTKRSGADKVDAKKTDAKKTDAKKADAGRLGGSETGDEDAATTPAADGAPKKRRRRRRRAPKRSSEGSAEGAQGSLSVPSSASADATSGESD